MHDYSKDLPRCVVTDENDMGRFLRREQERIERELVKTGEKAIGPNAMLIDSDWIFVELTTGEWGSLTGPQFGKPVSQLEVIKKRT